MGPNRTLQDPRVPYKTPKELVGACGILWDCYLLILKLAQLYILARVALYCNKETNDAIQYNASYKAKQNDAKLLIVGDDTSLHPGEKSCKAEPD